LPAGGEFDQHWSLCRPLLMISIVFSCNGLYLEARRCTCPK
jgi:hypothetical protein